MDQDIIKHRQDVMQKLDEIDMEIDRLKQLVVKQHDMIVGINKYLQFKVQNDAKEKA